MNPTNQNPRSRIAPTAPPREPPVFITYDIETAGMNDPNDALEVLKGQIVCVGFKEMGKDPVTFCGPDESKIVNDAWDYILAQKPTTVLTGFNIIDFDFQWIWKHGLKHCKEKVSRANALRMPQADIRKILGNNAQYAKGTLKEYCDFFGMTVKTKGSGAEVTTWAKAGEWDKIAAYNVEDLIAEEALAKLVLGIEESTDEPTTN